MGKIKLKDLVKLWKEDKFLFVKKSTFSTYSILIEKHILPYFENIDEINSKNIKKFIIFKLNQGLSQKSIKDIIVVLKMVLNYGMKNNLLNYQKIDFKLPSIEIENKPQILNKNEYKKILAYIKTHFSLKNLGIMLCLLTGMRIGEVCALKWGDIDLLNGEITIKRTIQRIYVIDGEKRYTKVIINNPKTKNSFRQVPIIGELLKFLKFFKKLGSDNFYIISNSEKPIEPRTYRNYYKRLLKKIGIEYIKFHGLRHSFATRCIESNCDYKTVSTILGHSSINTTLNLYVHPNLEQKRKCVEQMFKKLS